VQAAPGVLDLHDEIGADRFLGERSRLLDASQLLLPTPEVAQASGLPEENGYTGCSGDEPLLEQRAIRELQEGVSSERLPEVAEGGFEKGKRLPRLPTPEMVRGQLMGRLARRPVRLIGLHPFPVGECPGEASVVLPP
jgi:hypothetical protein